MKQFFQRLKVFFQKKPKVPAQKKNGWVKKELNRKDFKELVWEIKTFDCLKAISLVFLLFIFIPFCINFNILYSLDFYFFILDHCRIMIISVLKEIISFFLYCYYVIYFNEDVSGFIVDGIWNNVLIIEGEIIEEEIIEGEHENNTEEEKAFYKAIKEMPDLSLTFSPEFEYWEQTLDYICENSNVRPEDPFLAYIIEIEFYTQDSIKFPIVFDLTIPYLISKQILKGNFGILLITIVYIYFIFKRYPIPEELYKPIYIKEEEEESFDQCWSKHPKKIFIKNKIILYRKIIIR